MTERERDLSAVPSPDAAATDAAAPDADELGPDELGPDELGPDDEQDFVDQEDVVDLLLDLDEEELNDLAARSSEQELLQLYAVALLDEDDDYPEYTDKADLERQFVREVREFQAEIREMELAMLPEDNPRELELRVRELGLGDAAQNAALSDAAMRAVQAFFAQQGLETEDVSAQGCGWNLTVRAEREEIHVAVKGCVGEEPEFILTTNEYNSSRRDEEWTLIAVMNALGAQPILVEIPQEALEENREEIGYTVRLAGIEPDDDGDPDHPDHDGLGHATH